MRAKIFSAIAMAAYLFAAPALGNASCFDTIHGADTAAAVIADCTTLINGRDDDIRSVAYVVRGQAYFETKDYDRAIADFTEVILHGKCPWQAYLYRGQAWGRKGDADRAKADLDEWRRLKVSCRD